MTSEELEKLAEETMYGIVGAVAKTTFTSSESPEKWDRALLRAKSALTKVRKDTIRECAEIAAHHRMDTPGYLWKSCNAEIMNEILSLLTPTPDRCKHGVWLGDSCFTCQPNPSTKEK